MKNLKRLLLVAGILLVLVGVSFAYYVMRVNFTGSGSSVNAITKEINDVTVNITGNLSFNDTDILPGHKNISSIKLTATGEDKTIHYNLIWNGTNTLSSSLNYTIYKVDSEKAVSISCIEKEEYLIGEIRLYEECEMNNESLLGTAIATGTIATSSTETKVVLKELESITATSSGTTTYYYVVLEFPNAETEQTQVQNGAFRGTVTVEQTLGEQTCGTHNVTTTLGTLAVNDCEPNFSYTSEQAESGACIFNSESVFNVMSGLVTPETCQTIYKIDTGGLTMYLDSMFEQMATYVGQATWDDSTSTCAYEGTSLIDLDGNAIIKKEQCVEVYSFDGTNISGVQKVGEGTWTEIAGGTGIYEAEDDDGPTYYYRGSVDNNYVKFAGFYWRIIRINGNGSIRMIYAGDASVIDAFSNKEVILSNGWNDSDFKYTQIGESVFNTNNNQAEYVGFKYTLDSVHGTGTKSTILEESLEPWYQTNIVDKGLEGYIDKEAGFCGDRSAYTDEAGTTPGGGTGSTTTYFGAFTRLQTTNPTPSFKCQNSIDLYKTGIGLITADEAVFSGGGLGNNTSYYLYTGYDYLTMTPSYFNDSNTWMFAVHDNGSVEDQNAGGVRPVINLKADNLTITGSGTAIDPYVIS